jgi:hypothetical protein
MNEQIPMRVTKTKKLTLIAVIGLAQWFFGNFYEAIVLAPNMLFHSSAQLQRWHEYFTITNQIYYYVPFTKMATVLLWWLYWRIKDKDIRKELAIASIFGLLSILITVYIVTQLNLKLFFGVFERYRDELSYMTLKWNILNIIRVGLVGVTLTYTFKAYIKMRLLAIQP